MKENKETKDYINFLKKQPEGFLYKENISNTKTNNNEQKLEQIKKHYKNCQKCPLAGQGRAQVVFGQGNANAKLMLIGEGPGRDEDKQGIPFIGRAGQLLTKIIEAMKLKREDIYISNVVKCRPPGNRHPQPDESSTCKQLILFKEIEIIKPQIICTLGSCATQALLGTDIKISKSRGIFHESRLGESRPVLIMPTFHPAYLLRNPAAKKDVWEDMKKIMEKLKENN